MKVKIYARLKEDLDCIDANDMMELKEGATLGDACKKAKIPFALRHLHIISVNGNIEAMSYPLKEGDKIAFIGIATGG
ncbi:MoaD/ThiS family protein [Acidaminobacter sp. JC074]|uniref:MoaD/ThiS family protein n=1 Tax=Acidaminobacter sp. JC074 TaxID=2530199 RepID=UPI001F108B1B|nr:MoaD/ThiS family protein [Acidaminobacter sp. JC074]MCH4889409.1 MoaD/ThiS family protein [Acidaminobacter sp. JC074]